MMKTVFLILSLLFLGAGYLSRTRRPGIGESSRSPVRAWISSPSRTSLPESLSSHAHTASPDRTPGSGGTRFPDPYSDGWPDPDPEPNLDPGPSPPPHLALTLSSAGWVLFGLYWALHYPDYRAIGDWVNTVFSVAAMPLFLFMGYREITGSREQPGSGHEGLRFLSGITVVAMTGYTILSFIPSVELALEFLNAYLASLFLTLTGFPAEAGPLDFAGNSPWFRTNDNHLSVAIIHLDRDEILITLSCTAFSSILLFIAAIMTARESRARKLGTAMIIIPAIFLFNVIRMAMIAYLTYTGTTSAAFAHHILGKAGSLLALLFLAWVLFTFLPSIHESISGVFEVFSPVRDRKGTGKGVSRGSCPPS